MALLVLLCLSVQLLGAGQHKDHPAGHSDHCASCFFAHHIPSSLPDVEPLALPTAAEQSYPLLTVAVYEIATRVSFLIPRSQAPPGV